MFQKNPEKLKICFFLVEMTDNWKKNQPGSGTTN